MSQNTCCSELMKQNTILQEKLEELSIASKLSQLLTSTNNDLLYKDEENTEIILVRHGETYYNTENRLQGQSDSDLTPKGISGAINVGKKLHLLHKYDRKISYIYSSPLGRAKHTTQIVMKQFANKTDNKMRIKYDDRLMERHLGDLQGLTWNEIQLRKPKIYSKIKSNMRYKPPGKKSETKIDIYNRSIEFFAEIVSKHHGERILVIAHGGVLQSIFKDIINERNVAKETFVIKNCSINIIQRDSKNGKFYCSLLGDDNYGNLKEVESQSEYNNLLSFIACFAMGCAVGAVGYIAFKQRML